MAVEIGAWFQIPGYLRPTNEKATAPAVEWVPRKVLCFKHAVQAAMNNEPVKAEIGDQPGTIEWGQFRPEPCEACGRQEG